jgi:hypothetical protein
MKKHPLLPFFILAAITPCAIAQITNSTQKTALKSKSESPKWTEADKKWLLTKAQLGDAEAQMWLVGALEAERLAADWMREHECSVQDLRADLNPHNPGYIEAMELARVLRGRGFTVKCVLQSKMIGFFEGENGAALYRTDRGDFEGLFLPEAQTFAVRPIETRTDGRYIYSFAGSPRAMSGPLDSDKPAFFIQYKNQFLVTWEKRLAADLQEAVLSHAAQ